MSKGMANIDKSVPVTPSYRQDEAMPFTSFESFVTKARKDGRSPGEDLGMGGKGGEEEGKRVEGGGREDKGKEEGERVEGGGKKEGCKKRKSRLWNDGGMWRG